MYKKLRDKVKNSRNLQILMICCGAILFYVLITHLGVVVNAIGYILGILAPIIYAAIISFLLHPVVGIYENKVFGKIKKRKTAHRLCVLITIILLAVIVIVLAYVIIYQIAVSISNLISNLDSYVRGLRNLLNDLLGDYNKELVVFGVNILDIETSGLEEFVGSVMTWVTQHIDGILGSAMSIGSNLFNAFVTFMLIIYMLWDVDHLKSAGSRFFMSIMEPEKYVRFTDITRRSSNIFRRYFGSNLLDALIIGVACYVFMLIAGLPYAVLVAVIIGVFNLVPTFGPIVGAVISAFLILLVNPWGALWFIIYSLVTQFVDGNLLKPKLFGDTTGLRPMWVLAAIIICGGLFGVVGMLLGVPLFAIISDIFNERTEKRLQRWDYVKDNMDEEE